MVQSYRPPTQYAKYDKDAGAYRAGAASDEPTGSFVSNDYADKVRKNAKRQRLVSNVKVRNDGISDAEARARTDDFLEAYRDLENEFSPSEQRENHREYERRQKKLREKHLYGSESQ